MLRIEGEHRSVFFSGDTGWHDALPEHVGDTNLFISECSLWQKGFEFHLSHEELRKERARFRCERTVLTHLGSEVLDNQDRVEFDVAHDGLELEL